MKRGPFLLAGAVTFAASPFIGHAAPAAEHVVKIASLPIQSTGWEMSQTALLFFRRWVIVGGTTAAIKPKAPPGFDWERPHVGTGRVVTLEMIDQAPDDVTLAATMERDAIRALTQFMRGEPVYPYDPNLITFRDGDCLPLCTMWIET